MPLYEYHCQSCQGRFELLRPVARMDEPAICPEGHENARRVLSTFASIGHSQGEPAGDLSGAGGGCPGCAGGSCACSAASIN